MPFVPAFWFCECLSFLRFHSVSAFLSAFRAFGFIRFHPVSAFIHAFQRISLCFAYSTSLPICHTCISLTKRLRPKNTYETQCLHACFMQNGHGLVGFGKVCGVWLWGGLGVWAGLSCMGVLCVMLCFAIQL